MSSNQELTITWLGHATTRIDTSDGKVILIDPWLQENPAVPENMKTIDHVDLMLITHGHFDHISDAVTVAQQTRPEIISNFEICEWLGSKGIENCTGMNKGGTVDWNGIKITMVDAVHSSGIKDGDVMVDGGTAAGYVITFTNGFTVYHAGDTDVFESMRLIGTMYSPDVAMLPIGGHFTMDPRGATQAIRLLGVERVIPIHWGTFPLLAGTPEQLEQATSSLHGVRVVALQPGQSVTQSKIV